MPTLLVMTRILGTLFGTVSLVGCLDAGEEPDAEMLFLPRDVRMVVSAQRTLCTQGPNGLELCSTTYGLPLQAVGYGSPST